MTHDQAQIGSLYKKREIKLLLKVHLQATIVLKFQIERYDKENWSLPFSSP